MENEKPVWELRKNMWFKEPIYTTSNVKQTAYKIGVVKILFNQAEVGYGDWELSK